MSEVHLLAVCLACAVPSSRPYAKSAKVWAKALGERWTCSSPPPAILCFRLIQGGGVTCWEVKFPWVPVFPGKARVISIFPELELFPEAGAAVQPVVELK